MLKHCLVTLASSLILSASAAHADNLLAVGYGYSTNNGVIASSNDGGATWKEVWFQENGKVISLQHIAETNTYFALGRAGISRSTDTVNWTTYPVTSTFRPLHSIAYGDGMYVAVGERSTVVYSLDGKTWHNILYHQDGAVNGKALKKWQTQVGGMVRDAHYFSIIFHKGEFLATGSYQRITRFKRAGKKLVVSDDKRLIPTRLETARHIVAHDDQLFLFGRHKSWVSDDNGKTFKSLRALKKNSRPTEVKILNGKMVVGSYGKLIRYGNTKDKDPSNDWQGLESKIRSDIWTLALDDKNNLYATTNSSNKIYISGDMGENFVKLNYKMQPTPTAYTFVILDMMGKELPKK